MKDSHLTLRLSRELARALARWAERRGVPKSQLAREAVARYLAGDLAATAPGRAELPARALAARWASLPRLDPREADALGAAIEAARAALPAMPAPWR